MIDRATWQLVAPFPYFGGKRRVASVVWRALGDAPVYVEPFMGSAAVLLARPSSHAGGVENVNDADGLLANFWRAVQANPDAVAAAADWPNNENDLHARHAWLVGRRDDITRRLEGDPEWYDARSAGWWVWGACNWIGSGWCSGRGPWGVVVDDDGTSKLLHLGNAGRGVNRKLLHLGDAGRGEYIRAWTQALADRLRGVRVASGDWSRIVTPSTLFPTTRTGDAVTAVFLDPPYAAGEWTPGLYAVEHDVAHDVADWARANGNNPRLRIALCGYDSLVMPDGWAAFPWKARGGYGAGRGGRADENAHRETVWFSPHCLPVSSAISAGEFCPAGRHYGRRQPALFEVAP